MSNDRDDKRALSNSAISSLVEPQSAEVALERREALLKMVKTTAYVVPVAAMILANADPVKAGSPSPPT